MAIEGVCRGCDLRLSEVFKRSSAVDGSLDKRIIFTKFKYQAVNLAFASVAAVSRKQLSYLCPCPCRHLEGCVCHRQITKTNDSRVLSFQKRIGRCKTVQSSCSSNRNIWNSLWVTGACSKLGLPPWRRSTLKHSPIRHFD